MTLKILHQSKQRNEETSGLKYLFTGATSGSTPRNLHVKQFSEKLVMQLVIGSVIQGIATSQSMFSLIRYLFS